MKQPHVTLLVTRPRAAAEQFVAQIPAPVLQHLRLCYAPLIRISPSATDLVLGDARGLIFTSANGIAVAANLSNRRDLPAYCVGNATTQAARAAGWAATCAGDRADALVGELTRTDPSGPLLHLCGAHTRGRIVERLNLAGIDTRAQVIYAQNLLPLSAPAQAVLSGASPVIAPIFSPRTARHFAVQDIGKAPLYLLALSEAVAEPLQSMAFQALSVAAYPNATAMIAALEAIVTQLVRLEGGQGAQ